jgi:hypothetical protein
VGRQRIIDRERRWAVPAAVAAVSTFALYVASFLIDRTASLYTGASDARQLSSLHDHAGTILVSSMVRGLAFLLLPIPMLYLFRAAQARNPRVQAAMIGFIFIGPILFAAQGVVQAVGARQAASDFLTQAPSEGSRTYKQFQAELKHHPTDITKVTVYTASNQIEVQQKGGTFYSVDSYPDNVESQLPSALDNKHVDNETDSDSESTAGTRDQPGGDALAAHITDNSSTIQVAQALLFPAVLGLVVMMIYVPLQAQRVGLLTRFFGSLGMALGASMILILPAALLGTLVWTGYLGLLFVGRVRGGRPPAWEAGEAIPWPRPGEQAGEASGPGDQVIEGDAAEVSHGAGPSSGTERTPPAEKRKRKRRR